MLASLKNDLAKAKYSKSADARTFIARSSHRLGLELVRHGQFDEAIPYLDECIEHLQTTEGSGRSTTNMDVDTLASALVARSRVHFEHEQYEDVERMLQQAMSLQQVQDASQSRSGLLSTAYTLLGQALDALGRSSEAVDPLDKAVEHAVLASGPDSLRVATACAALGAQRMKNRQYSEALTSFWVVDRIHKATFPADSVEVATSCNNVGTALHLMKQYARAGPLLKRSLRIWERLYKDEPDHPKLAAARSNLACVHKSAQDEIFDDDEDVPVGPKVDEREAMRRVQSPPALPIVLGHTSLATAGSFGINKSVAFDTAAREVSEHDYLIVGDTTRSLRWLPQRRVSVYVAGGRLDTVTEREQVIAAATPFLNQYALCHECEAEIVDMRMDTKEDAANGPFGLKRLLLPMLRRCRYRSGGISFLAMLGDSLGESNLFPETLSVSEFEILMDGLDGAPREALKTGYQLQSRPDSVGTPLCCLSPELAGGADRDASPMRSQMRVAWKNVVRGILCAELIPPSLHVKPALEVELRDGLACGPAAATRAVIFKRNVRHATTTGQSTGQQQSRDSSVQSSVLTTLLSDVKTCDARCRNEHQPEGVRLFEFDIDAHAEDWKTSQAGREYLRELWEGVTGAVKDSVVDVHRRAAEHSEIDYELRAHMHCVREHPRLVGREYVMDAIASYVAMALAFGPLHASPFVMEGESGVGASAIIAECARTFGSSNVNDRVPATGPFAGAVTPVATSPHGQVTLIRFIGATAASTSSTRLMISMIQQLSEAYGNRPGMTNSGPTAASCDRDRLVPLLLAHLSLASRDRPLVVLIDGLERVSVENGSGVDTTWLPVVLPPHVAIITTIRINTADGVELHDAFVNQGLPRVGLLDLKPTTARQKRDAITSWMRRSKKPPPQFRLDDDDLDMIKSFAALRFLCRDTVIAPMRTPPVTLAEQLQAKIVHLNSWHGAALTAAVIGFLTASKHGLSSNELLDIVSCDEPALLECHERGAKSSSAPADRVPSSAVWRLIHDLGDLVVSQSCGIVTTWGWRWHECSEFMRKHFLATAELEYARHEALADYFNGDYARLWPGAHVDPQPLWRHGALNQRKLQELPTHLLHCQRWQQLEQFATQLETSPLEAPTAWLSEMRALLVRSKSLQPKTMTVDPRLGHDAWLNRVSKALEARSEGLSETLVTMAEVVVQHRLRALLTSKRKSGQNAQSANTGNAETNGEVQSDWISELARLRDEQANSWIGASNSVSDRMAVKQDKALARVSAVMSNVTKLNRWERKAREHVDAKAIAAKEATREFGWGDDLPETGEWYNVRNEEVVAMKALFEKWDRENSQPPRQVGDPIRIPPKPKGTDSLERRHSKSSNGSRRHSLSPREQERKRRDAVHWLDMNVKLHSLAESQARAVEQSSSIFMGSLESTLFQLEDSENSEMDHRLSAMTSQAFGVDGVTAIQEQHPTVADDHAASYLQCIDNVTDTLLAQAESMIEASHQNIARLAGQRGTAPNEVASVASDGSDDIDASDVPVLDMTRMRDRLLVGAVTNVDTGSDTNRSNSVNGFDSPHSPTENLVIRGERRGKEKKKVTPIAPLTPTSPQPFLETAPYETPEQIEHREREQRAAALSQTAEFHQKLRRERDILAQSGGLSGEASNASHMFLMQLFSVYDDMEWPTSIEASISTKDKFKVAGKDPKEQLAYYRHIAEEREAAVWKAAREATAGVKREGILTAKGGISDAKAPTDYLKAHRLMALAESKKKERERGHVFTVEEVEENIARAQQLAKDRQRARAMEKYKRAEEQHQAMIDSAAAKILAHKNAEKHREAAEKIILKAHNSLAVDVQTRFVALTSERDEDGRVVQQIADSSLTNPDAEAKSTLEPELVLRRTATGFSWQRKDISATPMSTPSPARRSTRGSPKPASGLKPLRGSGGKGGANGTSKPPQGWVRRSGSATPSPAKVTAITPHGTPPTPVVHEEGTLAARRTIALEPIAPVGLFIATSPGQIVPKTPTKGAATGDYVNYVDGDGDPGAWFPRPRPAAFYSDEASSGNGLSVKIEAKSDAAVTPAALVKIKGWSASEVCRWLSKSQLDKHAPLEVVAPIIDKFSRVGIDGKDLVQVNERFFRFGLGLTQAEFALLMKERMATLRKFSEANIESTALTAMQETAKLMSARDQWAVTMVSTEQLQEYLQSWSSHDVGIWLMDKVGLEEAIVEVFQREGINGKELGVATAKSLRAELGISVDDAKAVIKCRQFLAPDIIQATPERFRREDVPDDIFPNVIHENVEDVPPPPSRRVSTTSDRPTSRTDSRNPSSSRGRTPEVSPQSTRQSSSRRSSTSGLRPNRKLSVGDGQQTVLPAIAGAAGPTVTGSARSSHSGGGTNDVASVSAQQRRGLPIPTHAASGAPSSSPPRHSSRPSSGVSQVSHTNDAGRVPSPSEHSRMSPQTNNRTTTQTTSHRQGVSPPTSHAAQQSHHKETETRDGDVRNSTDTKQSMLTTASATRPSVSTNGKGNAKNAKVKAQTCSSAPPARRRLSLPKDPATALKTRISQSNVLSDD